MALLLFLITMTWSPGPNNVLFAAFGSEFKFKRVVPFLIGTNTAVLLYIVVVVFFSNLMSGQITEHLSLLSLFGGSYLMYLAYKLWNSGKTKATKMEPPNLIEGFLFGLSNYKAMYVAILANAMWLKGQETNILKTSSEFIFFFVAIGVLAHIVWFNVGKYTSHIPGLLKFKQKFFAVLLAGVALWMAFGV